MSVMSGQGGSGSVLLQLLQHLRSRESSYAALTSFRDSHESILNHPAHLSSGSLSSKSSLLMFDHMGAISTFRRG